MLVFVEGGKWENPEKNPPNKARTNNKLLTHMAPDQNQTQVTVVGGATAPSLLPCVYVVYWYIHSKVGLPLFSG